ncbi:hypothetical protein F2Q68_00039279 [Brassica cretica]|uniref:Uncharacterized protein n=1 Tax=Brassica cretica TaxID=69181 RepID=A0A8S9MM28_BRACR|nr:hypothetical protein F2Q68_00039279 [Brassica cretica]
MIFSSLPGGKDGSRGRIQSFLQQEPGGQYPARGLEDFYTGDIALVIPLSQVLLRPRPCSNLEENQFPRDRHGSSRCFQVLDLLEMTWQGSGPWSRIPLDVKTYSQGPLDLVLSERYSANHFLILETFFPLDEVERYPVHIGQPESFHLRLGPCLNLEESYFPEVDLGLLDIPRLVACLGDLLPHSKA